MRSVKILLSISLFALLLFSTPVKADVFPFNVRVTQPNSDAPFDGNFNDGTGARIHFMIQDSVQVTNATVNIKSGNTVVKTLTLTGIKAGGHSVLWDGSNNQNTPAAVGNYAIEITTAQTVGYTSYTPIFYSGGAGAIAQGLSTRGVTAINNPAVKGFGFVYGMTTPGGGSWAFTGIGRVASSGHLFGDSLGNAQLTTTGEVTGSANRRYSPVSDADGFIYIVGRDAGEVLRFNPETNVVSVFMTGLPAGATGVQGINVVGTGASKQLYLATTRAIWRANIGTASVYAGTVDSIKGAPAGFQFWDVQKGDGNEIYAVVNRATQIAGGGVVKYNATTMDSVWFLPVPNGDPVSLTLWSGANASSNVDDILYLSFDQINDDGISGVYAITGLGNATATINQVYQDPDGNTTRTRGEVALDYKGNLHYWENSNEQIVIISPPNGPNTTTLTAPVTINNTGITSVIDNNTPSEFTLSQNYPNPFNPATIIRFSLPVQSFVELRVYNINGEEVALLVNQVKDAGSYDLKFDASGLSSGTYIYRLRAGNQVLTQKMILMK
jgi:hypothetical protein